MSEWRRGIINGAETATCHATQENPKNHTTRSKHPHREPEIHMQLDDMQPGEMKLGEMKLGEM
jgi:hypothetical protein